MIIKERIHENLERFYSSDGFKIQKVGTDEIYDDAIELVELNREYVETNIPIDDETADLIEKQYAEAGRILLGEEIQEENSGEAEEPAGEVEDEHNR